MHHDNPIQAEAFAWWRAGHISPAEYSRICAAATPLAEPQRCPKHPKREIIATVNGVALCGECAIEQLTRGRV